MVKLLIDGKLVKFETTIFPDGTSQVWKLEDVDYDPFGYEPTILWMFENEGELMHVLQLANLVAVQLDTDCTLSVPYLPYARQDKSVSSNQTFALKTFLNTLYNAGICRVETFDAHSKNDMVFSTSPQNFHDSLFKLGEHHVICHPDKGAAERYKYSFNIDLVDHICFEKVRNQQTGEITGLSMLGTSNIGNRNILIVDDICDGGMTFIKIAEYLRSLPNPPARIDLAVSHGLFSKGKQVLYDAGITNIYTTNSLLRNLDGFKVVGDDYLR
jgi:ribose-phosphate pyrophosphokinase